MAKIRDSRRKAEQRQLPMAGSKRQFHSNLSFSEKEALREISAKDFKIPIRHGRY